MILRTFSSRPFEVNKNEVRPFLLDKKLSSVCYYKSGENLFQIKAVIIITHQNIGAELLPVVIARISEQNYCQNYLFQIIYFKSW